MKEKSILICGIVDLATINNLNLDEFEFISFMMTDLWPKSSVNTSEMYSEAIKKTAEELEKSGCSYGCCYKFQRFKSPNEGYIVEVIGLKKKEK